jgi:hypothetical protein
MSKAMVASKQGTAPLLPPGQPPQGAELAARRRGEVREALRAYHAAEKAVWEDAAAGVYAQMARAFPAPAISWVKDKAAWSGPQRVPLSRVDMADRGEWDASRPQDAGKVAKIARKMRRAAKSGKQPRPAVLVRWPGSGKDVAVDGHHHILAAEKAGQEFIWAYVGRVAGEKGPWLDTASREIRSSKAA